MEQSLKKLERKVKKYVRDVEALHKRVTKNKFYGGVK